MLVSLTFGFLVLSEGLAADYYWVGGSGNWTDPNHWATTSGGSTKYVSAPTILDNVIFDAGSFTGPNQVVTIPMNVTCQNMIWLGFTNNPTLRGASTLKLTVAGDINISGTMIWDFSGEVHLVSTNLITSINFGGNNLKSAINSNINPTGTLQLQGGLTSTKDLVISSGGFIARNQTLRVAAFQVFSGVPHTIELNNCQIYLNGGTASSFYLGSESTTLQAANTDLFFLSGGMTINKLSGAHKFHNLEADAANTTFQIINNQNTGTNIALELAVANLRNSAKITASVQYDVLNLTPGKSYEFKGGSLQRFNTLSANGNCSLPIFLNSLDIGMATMFNSPNTQNITFARIKDLTASGAKFYATSSSNLGNTLGWDFGPGSAGTTLYWVGGNGRWSDPAHWSTSSGGPGGACIPTGADRVIFDDRSFSGPGQTVTVDVPLAECDDMNWQAINTTAVFASGANSFLEINGSLTLSANLTNNFAGQITFQSNGPETIKTFNRPFAGSLVLDGTPAANWMLDDDLDCKELKLIGGTFNTSGWNVRTIRFESVGSNPRGMNLGTSTFSTNYWNVLYTGFTALFSNANVRLQFPQAQFINSGVDQTFSRLEVLETGARIVSFASTTTFNTAVFRKSASFTGSQTFNDVEFTAGYEYIFEAGKTFNMGIFRANGACRGMINFRSSGTLPATFKTSSPQLPSRIIVQNIIIDGPGYTATGSLKFGTTTGWNITNGTGRTLYWVGGTGVWEDIAHWSLFSGGKGGECLPTPVDSVIFDENSFSADNQKVTTAAGVFAQCKEFITRSGVRFADISLEDLEVYGSVIIEPGLKFFTGHLLLNGASTNSLQLSGQAIGDVTIYGFGSGSWTLLGPMNCGAISNLHGHLITNNFDISAKSLRFDNTARGTLGNSHLTLSSVGYANSGTFHIASSNVVINPGNYTIEITAQSGAAAITGTHSLANLYFSSPNGKSSLFSNDGDRARPVVTYKSVIFNNHGLIMGAHSIDSLIGSAGKTYELESGVTQRVNKYLQIRGNNCNRSSLTATTANSPATISGPAALKVVVDWVLFSDQNAIGGANFTAYNSLRIRGVVNGWMFPPGQSSVPIAGILGPDQVLCAGTPLILNQYKQIGALGYRWTNNLTADTFLVTAPGRYTVEAFFGAGCIIPDTIDIRAGSGTVFTLGPDTLVCGDRYEINSQLNASSGLTFDWDHNVNLDMPNIIVSTSGLYRLTVTSPEGCTSSDEVNIRLRTPPEVTTQANYDFCAGDSVEVDPVSLHPNIQLNWYDASIAATKVNFKRPGNYYVHVLDQITGCRDTAFFRVTEIPIPRFSLGPDTTACTGSSISLAPDQRPAGATYRWSNGSTASTLTINQSGTYALTITDRICTSSAARTVNMLAASTIRLPDTAICAGDTLMIDLAARGFSTGTAVWNPGALNGLQQKFTNGGTYTLDYTDGVCLTKDTFVLTVNPLPLVDLGFTDTTLCTGGSIALNAVTPGAIRYRWQDNNTASLRTITVSGTYAVTATSAAGCSSSDTVAISILAGGGLTIPDIVLCGGQDTLVDLNLGSAQVLWSNGATTDTIRLSVPGTYRVTVTQGVCADSTSFIVSQSGLPIQHLGADTLLCAGTSITLTPDLAIPGTTWVWEDGTSSPVRTITQPGTYWIFASANGCLAWDTIVVNYLSANDNAFQLNDTAICAGDSVVIDLSSAGGPVNWSHGASTTRVVLTSSGLYQVTVTQSTCDASDSFTLTVNPVPVQDLGPDTTLCAGQSLTLPVNTTLPGTSWQWENGSQLAVRVIDSSGTYSLAAQANGCSFNDEVTVLILDNSNPIILGDTSICSGDTLRINLGLAGTGATWSDGQSGPVGLFYTPGTYAVRVTQGNCSQGDDFTLLVNALPQQNLGSDTLLCIGESITLSVDASVPGTTWIWEDGSFAASRIIDRSGVYRVTASAQGCVSIDSLAVTVIDNSQNNMDIRDTAICVGDTLVLDLGLNGIQITWSDGQTGAVASFTQAARYWIDLIQGTCSTTDTFELALKNQPVFDLGPDTTLCSTLTYTLMPGTLPMGTAFLWQDGAVQPGRVVQSSGHYTLRAILDGCSYNDSVSVQFIEPLDLALEPAYDYCAGNIFSVSTAGTNLVWSNGQTGPDFSTTTPGEFYVSSFDGYCTSSDTFTVIEVPVPIFTLGADTVVCTGSRLSWDFTRLLAQSYLWQDSSNAPSFSTAFIGPAVVRLEAINYTASNLKCQFVDSIIVQVIDLPVFSLGNDVILCPGDDVLLTLPSGLPGQITWSDGSSDSTLSVDRAGQFSATADHQGCVFSDTVLVEFQKVDPVQLGADTVLCQGSRLELDAEVPGGIYAWSTGATTSRLFVTETGLYAVNVLNGLCVVADSIQVTVENCNLVDIFIPNVFSPNGDGINDQFAVHASTDIQIVDFQMVIADRLGNIVFTSNSMDQTWDGRMQNHDLYPGVYVYTGKVRYRKLNVEKSAFLQGDVTIVR